jgi:predicted ATPase
VEETDRGCFFFQRRPATKTNTQVRVTKKENRRLALRNSINCGMKILKLNLKGFRSLKQIDWQPGNLNVLIGPNASGKSNLMRAIEFISAAASGGLGRLVQDAGGIGALCWDNQKNAAITVRLKTSPIDAGRDLERESLTYDLELLRLGESSNFRVNGELLAKQFAFEHNEAPSPYKFVERRRATAHIYDETKRDDGSNLRKGLVPVPEDALQEEETVLSVAGNPIVGSFLQNRVITAYQRDLLSWSVYHAFGSHPESAIRKPLVVRHEKRVTPDGENLVSVLQTLYTSTRDFRQRIDDALRAAFPDSFEELLFQPVADQRVQLAIQFTGLSHPTPAANLSDGTLRFLFLLTILGSSEAGPVICVDEPEIGLHPSMLSIVAEFAVEASRRSQIIISTHSEALLNAFNGTLLNTTVVKWSEGATKLATFPEGQLAEWLKSYSLGALFSSGELENAL